MLTRSWSYDGTQSQGSAYIPDYMYMGPFSMLPYIKKLQETFVLRLPRPRGPHLDPPLQ